MSGFIMQKEKTVCFSGHRPEKLPCQGDPESPEMGIIRSLIYQAVADSIHDGYNCFITGAARGVDLIAGEIVLDLKRSGEKVHLVAAVPFREQPNNMVNYERFVYGCIINEADKVVYLSEKYYKGCMLKRNKFMVDNSSRLIAVVKDYKSGTGQTIRLAKEAGLDTRIINVRGIEEAAEESRANKGNFTVI